MEVSKREGRIDITWPEEYISAGMYAKIRNATLRETNYKRLEGRKLAEFRQFVRTLESVYECKISIDVAQSIRNVVLKDKIIRGYGKMNQLISRISGEYSTQSIVELSAKYDFPPLNLLRGILLFRRFAPAKIYDIFAGRQSPDGVLTGRNLQQYELALRNDAEASFNQREVAKVAAENEAAVVCVFNSVGIGMKTQDDLVREQMREHGRAVATPDILFTEPVYINGVRTHWIDYKDYTATEVPFIFNSNVDQASRYVEKWGPGVLAYRCGVIAGLTIPGAMCLSAEFLPVKFKSVS
jgi:hypothetical protein